jgi:DMSO/TMAO reductase YedYZ molybdopterin-dependent catalytic subunit
MDTVNVPSSTTTPTRSSKPGVLTGALVGLMLTIALVAIFYAANALVGTPFVPFDVLDWMTRNLPGGLITFGIETIVNVITTFNLGDIDVIAKPIEQIVLGIGGMLITGTVLSAVFFYLMNQRERSSPQLGYVLGLAFGVPVAAISLSVNISARVDPTISAIWIVLAFIGWGAAVQWVYSDLAVMKAKRSDAAVSAEGIDRRNFLVRVGGATAAITVVGAGLGAFLNNNAERETVTIADSNATDATNATPSDLPNADAVVQPVPGTRPEFTPVEDHYRIDISSTPPVIDGATYTLPITGLVNNPLDLSLEDIRGNYDPMEQYITLACISNPIAGSLTSTQKWTGISFQQILADADLQSSARYLRIFSADSFDETVAIDLIMQDERIMLTYDWDNQPLPGRNGFPLRIYIPDHYGMKQPKWITEIQVVDGYEDGYWVRRGWDRDAFMRATSVIDVVAADEAYEADGTTYIPIGGIAHAGDRSISKVEVRVDDGDWQEAELRDPLSDTTWVIWRYEWPFVEGRHTFYVRCTDGNGEAQITEPRSTHPSGATGIHSVSRQIDAPAEA